MAGAGVGDESDDEAALRWPGDAERGRQAPRPGDAVPADPIAARHDPEPEGSPASRGRAVAAAAFAVPYLILTVGWIFAVQTLASGSSSLFGEILWQFGEFLAMLAAPLWFAATLTVTRAGAPLVRVGWLALGLLVVFPWPLVLRLLAALHLAGSVS